MPYNLFKENFMDCNRCKYNNTSLNVCEDKEVFIHKSDKTRVVCRFDENAVPFKKVYKGGK